LRAVVARGTILAIGAVLAVGARRTFRPGWSRRAADGRAPRQLLVDHRGEFFVGQSTASGNTPTPRLAKQ
jgi:hypothetical protein